MTPSEGNPLPSRRALREQARMNSEAMAVFDPSEGGDSPAVVGQEGASLTGRTAPPAQSGTESRRPDPSVETVYSTPPTPTPPPLTRRERREKERQVATGAISLPTATAEGAVAPSAGDEEPQRAAGYAELPKVPPVAGGGLQASVGAPGQEPYRGVAADLTAPVAPESVATNAPTPVVPPPVAPHTQSTGFQQPPSNDRVLSRRERRELERRGEPVANPGQVPALPDPLPPAGTSPPGGVGHTGVGHTGVGHSGVPGTASDQSLAGQVDQVQLSGFGAPPDTPLPPVFGPSITQDDTHTASARTVGVGLDATHALILPVAPTMDVTGPIGDTGEVLMTGNIALPRHVSEQALTGALEMEEDLSPYDRADGSSFTTPIRASDAVSSRTAQVDQPMIQRPRWGLASIVLGSSAAILGVTALGLLALALLTDIVELPF